MVKITGVEKGSRAARAGVIPGDVLVNINGNEINDVLDYRFYLAERTVRLSLLRDGKELSVTLKKGEYDDIGLLFETALMDKKQTCRNKCIFCFIDQNPEGMRDTVYFKDDDSRLSFIHGNYITLTNLTDKDVARIVKMHISPIRVSIHTTNPELRVSMMKNKRSGEVLSYLDDFKAAGLDICGQIVLCKGINDGEELLRTMRDLTEYYPSLTSVSVVPAGLTKHREGLYPLSDFTPEEAGAVIDLIDSVASEHLKKHGSRLFFAADELYLKAGRELPPDEYYEDYPQIENGVGMLRSLITEFGLASGDIEEYAEGLSAPRRVAIATGYASYKIIGGFAELIESKTDKIKIDVYPIKNDFFGESITVSGLLTGRDIYAQLKGRLECDELLLPSAALRHPEMDFLCGMTLGELGETLGVNIRVTENDGFDLLDAIFGV